MNTYSLASLFDDTIGFNRNALDLIESNRYAGIKYPVYNIVDVGDNKYAVELAVAGFDERDLTVEKTENRLVISGTRRNRERNYLHKGIAEREFQRTFVLNDNVEVVGADYINGILSVSLVKVVPEEKRPMKIAINSDKNNLLT
jgi:molecular chaperone IbpA